MIKLYNPSVYILIFLGSLLTPPRVQADPYVNCPEPFPIQNGHWEIYSSLCELTNHCNIASIPGLVTMNAGTKLVYFCDNGYSLLGLKNVSCADGGSWSPIPRCVACGTDPLANVTILPGSEFSGQTMNLPWHASLYQTSPTPNKRIFVCSATIITDTLFITAAKCVFNEDTKELLDPSEFYIRVGVPIVLRLQVSEIYKNCNYQGAAGDHDNNIAIVQVKPRVRFNQNLFPICLDENKRSLDLEDYGLIAHLKKEGRTRPVFKSSLVPVLSKNDCIRQSAIFGAQRFVTRDKFCTGYMNGSAACPGNYGSGLAFKKDNSWYIRGILSVIIQIDSTENEATCDKQKSMLCTDVAHHMSWIQDIMLRVELGKSIPKCPSFLESLGKKYVGPAGAEAVSDVFNGCSAYLFRCNNGTCIDRDFICDGNPDCIDASDEILLSCSGCNATGFKCTTGQCIDIYAVCDGSSDCPDRSDETAGMCGGNESDKKPGTTGTPQRDCPSPPRVCNGRWKLHFSQCPGGNDNCDPPKMMIMVPGTHLVYSCDDEYHLTDSEDVYCASGGKWSVIPQCKETECKVLETSSTIAACSLNGDWISCAKPVPPGTQADLSCRSAYRQEESAWKRNHVTCNSRGLWEPEPIECIPECGITPSRSVTPLIVDGFMPNITEFPWHATLYATNPEKSVKSFTCGATVITENLLITAAHCIFAEQTKKPLKPEGFLISVGNIYKDYDRDYPPHIEVRRAQVINIYMNCDYQGYSGNYDQDIAILQVEPSLNFTSYFVPICLDTTTRIEAINIGTHGKVAGFGRTATGPSSEIIRALSVPVVPKNKCLEQAQEVNAQNWITSDKFCAGYTNGSSVCNGDSGGGLTFETNRLSYLRGIVSSGIGVNGTGPDVTCNNYRYTIYTEVAKHISWIQDVMLKVKNGQSIPVC